MYSPNVIWPQGHCNCFELKSFSHHNVWTKWWNMARKMPYQRIKTIYLFPVERSLLACLFLRYLNHILFIISSTAQDCLLTAFQNSQFCNSLAKSLTHFSTSSSFIALINVAVVINSKILKNRDLFYSLNHKDLS